MWLPPWRSGHAFGALAADDPDMVLAAETAAAVRTNIREGRPFYSPIPQAFLNRFQKNYRGIFNYVNKHPAMPAFNEKGERVGKPKDKDPDRERTAVKIVNKTFYNALRGIEDYRGEAPLTSWFYVIAHNALVDELRVRVRIPVVRERARAPWAEERFDDATDDDSGHSMKLLLEATESTAARRSASADTMDERDKYAEVRRRAAMLRKMMDGLIRERDQYGVPYISSASANILAAYAQSLLDYREMARVLGISELAASMKTRAALSELAAASKRLADAKRRAALSRGPIKIVNWSY